jgi:mannosyltransferase
LADVIALGGADVADAGEHDLSVRQLRGSAIGKWLQRALPPVLTLGLTLAGITGPSYSRDEAATLSAVRRPFPKLLAMLRHVDIFHGAYYVLIWPVVRVFGASEIATRVPSALAMAIAALATAAIATRLISPGAGLASGLAFAILPEVTYYGQTARPYAIATGLAAVATYILVRAMTETRGSRATAAWMAAYALSMTALCYLHPFALLLLAAHFVPVAARWLRNPRDRAAAELGVSWVAAGVASALLSAPLLVESDQQSVHISMTWTKAPVSDQLRGLTSLIGPFRMAAAAGLVVLLGILVSLVQGRARLHARWPADLLMVSVSWLILPALILILYSAEYRSLYAFRYVVFCMPAAALLIGAGLSAIGWRAGIVAFACIAVLGYSDQVRSRSPAGHGDNILAADRYLAARARPGDVELYTTFSEPIGAAYPFGLSSLPNVVVGKSAIATGTLGGKWVPFATERWRLEHASRLWYIVLPLRGRVESRPTVIGGLGFRLIGSWHTNAVWIWLYTRSPVTG